jgi:serine/threonine protein kinase
MNSYRTYEELQRIQFENKIISEIVNKNQVFDSTFSVHRIIGQGGSGFTLEAELGKSGKIVALKYIRRDAALFEKLSKEDFKTTIINEITLHFNLKQENICKFLGYYNIGDNFIIVLELCQYGNIKDFLKSFKSKYNRKLSVSEPMAGYIVAQVLQALKKLQKMSVVHFDIKIENVLIDDEFTVKLSDFSISKRISRSAKKFKYSSSFGTGVYIAPENLFCEEVDVEDTFKADLYSLGVLIFKLVFKFNPYGIRDSDNKLEISKKICENVLHFPEDVSISEELKSLLRRLLEKNVRKRCDLGEIESNLWVKNLKVISNCLEFYPEKENLILDLLNDDIPEFYTNLTKVPLFKTQVTLSVDESFHIPNKSMQKEELLCTKKRRPATCY